MQPSERFWKLARDLWEQAIVEGIVERSPAVSGQDTKMFIQPYDHGFKLAEHTLDKTHLLFSDAVSDAVMLDSGLMPCLMRAHRTTALHDRICVMSLWRRRVAQ